MTNAADAELRTRYLEELEAFQPTRQKLEALITPKRAKLLARSFDRTVIWCRQLSETLENNDATGILSAMNSSVLEGMLLVPLGLFHAAAASMRAILDMAISFSYFFDHPSELSSLIRGRPVWLGRRKIQEWHAVHTPGFEVLGEQINPLWDSLYGSLSGAVHCLPGSRLPDRDQVGRWQCDETDVDRFITIAQRVDTAVNLLFIAKFGHLVSTMASQDHRKVTSGLAAGSLKGLGITPAL